MQAKVAVLPPLNRQWRPFVFQRADMLPPVTSPLRLSINRLVCNGSSLPTSCGNDLLSARLLNLRLLQCNFSWERDHWPILIDVHALNRCIAGAEPEVTLEARSRIRTVRLRADVAGGPGGFVPAMLSLAQCFPQLTDLTVFGRGHGESNWDAMLDNLAPLRTLKRLHFALDTWMSSDYILPAHMRLIASLPLLTRLEVQEGVLSVSCLRSLLQDECAGLRA